MSTHESQKTYTLKFTIGQSYGEGPGEYDPRADLDRVMGPGSATLDDLIKAEVEAKIQKAIPMIKGAVMVKFDSLTETE